VNHLGLRDGWSVSFHGDVRSGIASKLSRDHMVVGSSALLGLFYIQDF
jgi:hypothetical protein